MHTSYLIKLYSTKSRGRGRRVQHEANSYYQEKGVCVWLYEGGEKVLKNKNNSHNLQCSGSDIPTMGGQFSWSTIGWKIIIKPKQIIIIIIV